MTLLLIFFNRSNKSRESFGVRLTIIKTTIKEQMKTTLIRENKGVHDRRVSDCWMQRTPRVVSSCHLCNGAAGTALTAAILPDEALESGRLGVDAQRHPTCVQLFGYKLVHFL